MRMITALLLLVAAGSTFGTLKPHPRLFVSGVEDFARFNERAAKDELWGSYREFMLADADRIATLPNVKPEKTGRRLLEPCWEVTYRLASLATAYRLTGDERYLVAAKRELLAACAWETWNPSHYLDVASMQIGVAVAYDWLFDSLAPDERSTVRSAIVAKGWDEAENTTVCWWKTARNNWQAWCWCGVVMAAIAIHEDVPERADKYIAEAMKNLPTSLRELAPKGCYPEGVGYWGAGIGRAVMLAAAYESALGKECPIVNQPGFLATGEYPVHMYDPMDRAYDYGDAGSGTRNVSAHQIWLAKRAGHPEWLHFVRKTVKWRSWVNRRGGTHADRRFGVIPFLLPLWTADMDFSGEDGTCRLPTDWSGEGPNPIVTMRTAWDNSKAAFIAIKGGKAKVSHGHMDSGSFIYAANGVRWAVDLGAQGYYSIEKLGMSLWDGTQNGDRWKVFRLSEKGHNLVTIDGQQPNVVGMGKIAATDFGAERSTATLDLTEVFAGQATKAGRRASLDKRNGAVVISDGFRGVKSGAVVKWNMLSLAESAVVDGSTVVLQSGKHHLKLTCRKPAGTEWKFEDASAPANSWDQANKGLKRVWFAVSAPESGDVKLEVELLPVD